MGTDRLIKVIQDTANTQADIAKSYALAIRQDFDNRTIVRHAPTDWPAVNQAILARYKPSGLNRIKEMAWKRVNQLRAAGQEE